MPEARDAVPGLAIERNRLERLSGKALFRRGRSARCPARPRRTCARRRRASPRSCRRSARGWRSARPARRACSRRRPHTAPRSRSRRRARAARSKWTSFRNSRGTARRRATSGEWNAVATGSRVLAIPASASRASTSAMASVAPESTTCFGLLWLATTTGTPHPAISASTSAAGRPTARHRSRGRRRGRCHQLAATRATRTIVASSKAPAACSAVTSPKLWPPTARGRRRRARAAARAARGSRRRSPAAPTPSR